MKQKLDIGDHVFYITPTRIQNVYGQNSIMAIPLLQDGVITGITYIDSTRYYQIDNIHISKFVYDDKEEADVALQKATCNKHTMTVSIDNDND